MRILLNQIKEFSQCPRYYHNRLSKNDDLISSQLTLFNFILKRCHMQATETGYRAKWRSIVGWVDSQIFKDVDIDNTEMYEQAKKNSEYALIGLQKWYERYYLEENYETYVDIDLWQEAGDHYVGDRLPLVQVTDPPIITLIQDVSMIPTEIYNDIRLQGLAYLAFRTLRCDSVKLRLVILGPKGGVEIIEQILEIESGKRAWKSIKQVARLIVQGVDYASRTEKCKSCSFLRRCKL